LSKSGAQIQNPRGTTDRGRAGSMQQAASGACPSRAAKTWQKPHIRGSTGAAAPVLRARDCLPGPFALGAYKLPLGVLQRGNTESRVLEVVFRVVSSP